MVALLAFLLVAVLLAILGSATTHSSMPSISQLSLVDESAPVVEKSVSVIIDTYGEAVTKSSLTQAPAFHVAAWTLSARKAVGKTCGCSAWRCWPRSLIAGVTAAAVLGVVAIGVFIWWWLEFPGTNKKRAAMLRRKKRRRQRSHWPEVGSWKDIAAMILVTEQKHKSAVRPHAKILHRKTKRRKKMRDWSSPLGFLPLTRGLIIMATEPKGSWEKYHKDNHQHENKQRRPRSLSPERRGRILGESPKRHIEISQELRSLPPKRRKRSLEEPKERYLIQESLESSSEGQRVRIEAPEEERSLVSTKYNRAQKGTVYRTQGPGKRESERGRQRSSRQYDDFA
ncbi:hypothetical protein BJ878DRAFT_573581 [Calycina marina]|uniref:Transmembrane protein n=1 Tax=Calycina marina TaxID=1763456 RepID=A0A9P8CH60_9HELO|nr:hypothetical protein BJ878DRAFT_573581 [Calycina marina]